MAYKVVRIAQSMGSDEPYREITKVDSIDTRESALVIAEVACSEHADGIMTDYQPCGNGKEQTGFTFRTSNGTQVWYVAKAEV